MNPLLVLSWANQIGAIALSAPKGLAGDVLLYWAARKLAERLQNRNPGISQNAGFTSSVDNG